VCLHCLLSEDRDEWDCVKKVLEDSGTFLVYPKGFSMIGRAEAACEAKLDSLVEDPTARDLMREARGVRFREAPRPTRVRAAYTEGGAAGGGGGEVMVDGWVRSPAEDTASVESGSVPMEVDDTDCLGCRSAPPCLSLRGELQAPCGRMVAWSVDEERRMSKGFGSIGCA